MIISTFQASPCWVTLQAVVLHGKSPLPAEIRVKCDPEGSDFRHLPKRSRGIPLGQQDVLVMRSSSSKEKFMETMFKCSFGNFYRTLQSTLLA